MRATVRLAACAVLLAGALWYLRDPGWVAAQTTGLRPWERGSDGTRYRWSAGHASFFVPSHARQIDVPIATTFDPADTRPMIVTFTIDDARAGRALLTDARWRTVPLTLPEPGSRRVRRVDVRTSVTRPDNRGVMIGEVRIVPRED